ncbi:hypothetical protein [Micromonospora coerulea]|uniref:hypothetical protein n=1 Tax=Micromonospora coerulea TaxID=47856 RepID=UPI001905EED8|nr:hypothetical protein [Micromonospora veneta]
MTTPSGASPEDDYWRRPPDQSPPDGTVQPAEGPGAGGPASGADVGGPGAGARQSGYSGPPPTTPPPPGWRPPIHVQVPPPRQLPPQDMAGLDQGEQRAQRLTYGFGAVAAVVLVLLTCLLCSRVIF